MAEEAALSPLLPITFAQLRQAMPFMPATKAQEFLPHLNEAMARFEINTPFRVAMFIACLAHESGSFRYMEEIADGTAYEDRADLGNTLPEAKAYAPDGKAGPWFKGHGPIQTTGYHNHKRAGERLYDDPERFLKEPGLLAEPLDGCLAAGLYWQENGCNEVADEDNFLGTQQIVNMGRGRLGSPRVPNGWQDRQDQYARARVAFGMEEGA